MSKDLIVCDQNNTKQFYMLSVVFIHKKNDKRDNSSNRGRT